jgi:hypothetical protein
MDPLILVGASAVYLGIFGVAVVVKLFKSFAPAKVKAGGTRPSNGGTGYLQ